MPNEMADLQDFSRGARMLTLQGWMDGWKGGGNKIKAINESCAVSNQNISPARACHQEK